MKRKGNETQRVKDPQLRERTTQRPRERHRQRDRGIGRQRLILELETDQPEQRGFHVGV